MPRVNPRGRPNRQPDHVQITKILRRHTQHLLGQRAIEHGDEAGGETLGDLGIGVRGEPHAAEAIHGHGDPDLGSASHDTVGGDAVGLGEGRKGRGACEEALDAIKRLRKGAELIHEEAEAVAGGGGGRGAVVCDGGAGTRSGRGGVGGVKAAGGESPSGLVCPASGGTRKRQKVRNRVVAASRAGGGVEEPTR